jgi:hypothetical protein
MQGPISHILEGELADLYCGKNVLNELFELMAEKVHSKIIPCIQSAEYFSVIANCTPGIIHME